MSVKNLLIIIEIIITAFFVFPIVSNIINPGNIAGILISGILLSVTIFHKKIFSCVSNLWCHTGGKILLILASILIISGIIYIMVLTTFMIVAKSDKPKNPDAVIVLGCKVNGKTPSRMLRRRLDSAEKYLKENEDVICIVSGGKGDDEEISEAQAMKIYLEECGISSNRIVMEDRSVNTYENLENSLNLLDGNQKEITIVTDGFHQYRAGYIAKNMGFDASAINAEMDFYNVSLAPTYYVREWMAISNEYIKELKN